MKRVYALFLSLYPREYRDLFGIEVLDVFAQAAAEQRSRGIRPWLWFLVVELSAAVVSAASHWIDRLLRRERPAYAGTPLQRMTQAIARHDFIAARAWSIEDLKSRQS